MSSTACSSTIAMRIRANLPADNAIHFFLGSGSGCSMVVPLVKLVRDRVAQTPMEPYGVEIPPLSLNYGCRLMRALRNPITA
ncbi:MAG TPA: hypothetical protein VEI05_05300 [Burkholderiaceae bacterium]|nr:hypothetical protein [Burkholderiaceae bacterium]